MHQLLEAIEWLDEEPATEDLGAVLDDAAASVPVLALPLLPSAREAVERTLQSPDGSSHFSREETARRLATLAGEKPLRIEVARELPYAVESADGLTRGTIDRLHIAWGKDGPLAAEVVDAKSDGDSAGETLLEKYAAQLDAYRDAVVRLWGIPAERVSLLLLRVPSGERGGGVTGRGTALDSTRAESPPIEDPTRFHTCGIDLRVRICIDATNLRHDLSSCPGGR